jgi:hypothetical protein
MAIFGVIFSSPPTSLWLAKYQGQKNLTHKRKKDYGLGIMGEAHGS